MVDNLTLTIITLTGHSLRRTKEQLRLLEQGDMQGCIIHCSKNKQSLRNREFGNGHYNRDIK